MALGIIFALLSSIALGNISSFAALSYRLGGGALDLIFLRGVIAFIVIWGFYRLFYAKENEPLTKQHLIYSFAIGLGLSAINIGYMGSVFYLTPGLAVAIFYLFPIIVLIVDCITRKQLPHPIIAFAFAIALVGITVSLNAGGSEIELPIEGVLLALLGAIGMVIVLITTSKIHQQATNKNKILILAQPITIVTAGLLLFLVRFEGGDFIMLPQGNIGLIALFIATILYPVGYLLSFAALRYASACVVALMLNMEPITTLIVARFVVGENLTLIQYAGIILAVSGIALGGFITNYNHETKNGGRDRD